MDAADRRVGQNHLPNPLHQLLLRRLAQQRSQRLLGRLIPGKEDEARHHKAHPTVDHQGGEPSHQHSRQHRRGGDGIGQAVGGRGLHGGGRYPPADTAVIQVHIQLHGDGCHQNPHRQQTEVHRLRVQDLLHGGLPQLHTHQQDQSRHYKTRYVLDAPVAEGVLGVRLLSRQLKAQQRHHRRACIRQVVEGICRHGHRAADSPGEQLSAEQQQVQTDPYQPAQAAVGQPYRRISGIFPVPDQPMRQ